MDDASPASLSDGYGSATVLMSNSDEKPQSFRLYPELTINLEARQVRPPPPLPPTLQEGTQFAQGTQHHPLS